MSYRFYNPAPVFFDLLGIQPLAGGSLEFYDLGTTTPKMTWSDPDLTIPNTNPVQLDSSGRAGVNIWLDGAYRVVLLDSLGATVWDRDVNSGDGAGSTIPALLTGQYLTNDGSTLQWSDIRQVPDPTGSSGKILGTDGTSLIWQAPATPPTVPTSGDGFTKVGTNLEQWGVATMPANNLQSNVMSFNFPTPYAEVPRIFVNIQKAGPIVTAGFTGVIKASPSVTGATVEWNTGVETLAAANRLTSPFEFSWFAVGKAAS